MTEIDINVVKPERVVDIIVEPNIITVNVTVSGGGGGGAVDSVNGQTGAVVLDATDVGAYTTSEVDNLLNDKFDNPTGDNTQYLDGAGVPTTFPTIPAAQVNSDWNATSGVAQILNKPTIPEAVTKTSDLINDGEDGVNPFITLSDIPPVTGFVPYTGANQNVDLGEYEIKAGQLELDQTPTGTAGVAVTRWNDSLGSTETTLKGGNVILKNGVDLVARVVNKVTPNTTLTKANYPAVRISGAQGQRLAVAYAQANNDNNSADTIGLVCETIATNQQGFIITVGQLEGINTTGSLQGETWSDGDVLYLSPTTAGRLTNIKPTGATGHIVVIGYVEYAHAVNGKIYVKIMNGWELDELHNVNISSPTDNQVLAYTSSTQLWENKSVGTALGFTPENVTNKATNLTSPDNNKYPTTLALATALAGKADNATVTDISLTSTIVGWSSFTVRDIRVIDLGSFAIVFFRIQGTSNSTAASFTLPFNSTVETSVAIRTVNNGINQTATGLARIVGSSNIVECFQNLSFMTFASSNGKLVIGQILITK
jgi:nitrogen fixation protein